MCNVWYVCFCAIYIYICVTSRVLQGICEPGENVWNVLKTDFTEEALGSLMDDLAEKERVESKLDMLSKSGFLVLYIVLSGTVHRVINLRLFGDLHCD